jgi:hypothetical protein
VSDAFQAVPLRELLSARPGQSFLERRSSGDYSGASVRPSLVEYRAAHRALMPGARRPSTIEEFWGRLEQLERGACD